MANNDVTQILQKVETGEFQDNEDVEASAAQLGRAVALSWQQPSNTLVLRAHQALARAMAFPEHRKSNFANDPNLLSLAFARAQIADEEAELPGLLSFVLRCIAVGSDAIKRQALALCAGGITYRGASIAMLKLSLETIDATLSLCPQVAANSSSSMSLLTQVLLPLHSIQGKLSPTQSILGGFHRELTLCTSHACILANSPAAWELALCELSGPRYPGVSEGNSPKEVLFLHELEVLVNDANKPLTGKARSAVVSRLLQCVGSLHAAVCERALAFWRSDNVVVKLEGSDQLLSKTCDRALAKSSLDHWSPTVKTMAGAALLKSNKSPPGAATSTFSSTDPFIMDAVQRAKERERQLAVSDAIASQSMPMPKTFSSTSVIRDATEPFAFGAFGVIWKGRAIVAGVGRAQWPQVALKEIDDAEAGRKEAEAMQRCGLHPNVVGLLGVFDVRKGAGLSLVLEFVDGPGDLHTCVVDRGCISLEACKFICGEVGSALRHIHSRGLVFGDVKPENILLTKEGHAKLCDFGSAFVIGTKREAQVVGTVEYMPPEQDSSIMGDWWAFGCVVHFCLTGRPPVFFDSEIEVDLAAAFNRAVTFADQQGGTLLSDTHARQLVAGLCSRSPAKRPADGGESMAFFTGFRPWNSLHTRESVPALPSLKGASANKTARSPWQRRTFSTIHSPMPGNYSIDASLKSLCFDNVSSVPGLALPNDWTATGTSIGNLFRDALDKIPSQRLAAETSAGSTNSVPSQYKRTRRTPPTYTVAGVDLTAG